MICAIAATVVWKVASNLALEAEEEEVATSEAARFPVTVKEWQPQILIPMENHVSRYGIFGPVC